MVQNRNWEKRVELANARRKESKQRKQRSEDKRNAKRMVQELFEYLDQHADRLERKPDVYDDSCTIHIWTDALPSDSPPLLEVLDTMTTPGKSSKRRPRSGSLESDTSSKSGGSRSRSNSFQAMSPVGRARSNSFQRARSNSFQATSPVGRARSNSFQRSRSNSFQGTATTPPSGNKKKSRKDGLPAVDLAQDDPLVELPGLCRCHFFTGKCEEIRCRHLHYSSEYPTLASVAAAAAAAATSNKDGAYHQHSLEQSEQASKSNLDTDLGSMDMIYYFPVEMDALHVAEESRSISDRVAEAMSSRSCGIGSIVYLAIGNVLLFDRYREGVLLVPPYLLGNTKNKRHQEHALTEDECANNALLLPSQLLEHVLSFLPDTTITSAMLVCKSWYREFQHISPGFWRHLLERRHWPLPQNSTSAEDLHNEYVRHYSIVRDIKALGDATTSLIANKKMDDLLPASIQAFSTRKSAPQFPNSCVAVQVWSPKRILVAYAQDCTLRLFNAGSSARGGSCDKLCREVVRRSVDPYPNTKKRTCRLISMGLDEETIGALCHVTVGGRQEESFVLTVLSRESFLVEDTQGQTEIDIGQAVLNYLLSCEEIDENLLQLHGFLAMDGNLDDIEILASHSLAACGNGLFMVEVSISIPQFHDHEDDDDSNDGLTMQLLDRKLVLFSAGACTAVWMGNSYSMADLMQPRHQDMSVAATYSRDPRGHRTSCHLAAVSPSSPVIMTAEIDTMGQVQHSFIVEPAHAVRNEILQEGYTLRRMQHRPAVATSSEVIVADTVFRQADEDNEEFKTIVSFYPRKTFEGQPNYSSLTLEGNCEVVRLAAFRGCHVVLICRVFCPPDIEGLDGTWFGERGRVMVYAIVIDISTRSEIERICLLEDLTLDPDTSAPFDVPILLSTKGDTVGAGLWWKGVVMTGNDVRFVSTTTHAVPNSPSRASKKKKKRLPNKGGKKDVFARGMTMRG